MRFYVWVGRDAKQVPGLSPSKPEARHRPIVCSEASRCRCLDRQDRWLPSPLHSRGEEAGGQKKEKQKHGSVSF